MPPTFRDRPWQALSWEFAHRSWAKWLYTLSVAIGGPLLMYLLITVRSSTELPAFDLPRTYAVIYCTLLAVASVMVASATILPTRFRMFVLPMATSRWVIWQISIVSATTLAFHLVLSSICRLGFRASMPILSSSMFLLVTVPMGLWFIWRCVPLTMADAAASEQGGLGAQGVLKFLATRLWGDLLVLAGVIAPAYVCYLSAAGSPWVRIAGWCFLPLAWVTAVWLLQLEASRQRAGDDGSWLLSNASRKAGPVPTHGDGVAATTWALRHPRRFLAPISLAIALLTFPTANAARLQSGNLSELFFVNLILSSGVAGLLVGLGIGYRGLNARHNEMPTWLSTQPLNDYQLCRAHTRALEQSLLLYGLGACIVSSLVFAAIALINPLVRETAWNALADSPGRALIGCCLGLAICWIVGGLAAAGTWTGRSGFLGAVVTLSLLSWLAGWGLASWIAWTWTGASWLQASSQVFRWSFPCLLIGLTAVISLKAARHGLMTVRLSLANIAVMIGCCSLAVLLVLPVSVHRLWVVGFSSLVAAPLPAAHLAIRWNRRR